MVECAVIRMSVSRVSLHTVTLRGDRIGRSGHLILSAADARLLC